MSVSSVSYIVPSNSWTGSIDVSDCNLDSDLSVADYKIFYDTVEQGTGELANWSKVSRTSLSYSGSSLNQNDVVLIRRNTPDGAINQVQPLETISASLWNAELDRCSRRDEEIKAYGTTTDSLVGISDEAYSSGWDAVTTQAPSKNAVYDRIQIVQPIHHMGGRLTSSSTDPFPSTNTGATTLYYLPYTSNVVYLYDGTRWTGYTFTSVSLALSGLTDNLPYDVFLYNNAGTLTLELTAWTNVSTRATGLAYQDGVLVKTGATTRRYVGTISPVSNLVYVGFSSTSSAGGILNTIFNMYNREPVSLETTTATVYDTALAFDGWDGSTAFKVMIGRPTIVTMSMFVDHLIITGSTTAGYQMLETSSTNFYGRVIKVLSVNQRTGIGSTVDNVFSARLVQITPQYYTSATANMSTQFYTLIRMSFEV